MKKQTVTLLLFLIVATSLLAAEAPPEPTFRAQLESSITAKITGDISRAPSIKLPSPTFENLQGDYKGIVRGDCKGALGYQLPNESFANHEGTVSCWVKILFDPKDHHFFSFFNIYSNGHISFYKHEGSSNIVFMLTGRDVPPNKMTLVRLKNTYENGDVIHLAATWLDGMVQVYWNGQLTAELANNTVIAPNLSSRADIIVGGHALEAYGVQTNLSRENNMIIRDLRVYNEQLDAEQIEQIYQTK